MDETKSPDQILDTIDRGDDTQRRFRYQNSCACFISINMLNDDCTYEEVFCEHHEDILLKLKNGKFAGVQIKTRDINLGPFKINDDAIYNSIKRFVSLNVRFQSSFEYFVLATNVGFLKCNSSGIRELKKLIEDNVFSITKRNTFSSVIKKIISEVSKQLNITLCEEDVLAVIKKIKLHEGLPQITDIDDKLFSMLSRSKALAYTYMRVLKKVIDDIVIKHYNASSLSFEGHDFEYYVFNNKTSEEIDSIIIKSKKITKDDLLDIISENIQSIDLIKPQITHSIFGITPSTIKLEKKLDAGNVNIENVNIMKDDKYAFESLMTERFYKKGQTAEDEYNHIRHIILSECQDAYDRYDKNTIFGTQMLNDIRDRIKERLRLDKKSLLECTPEHLLGMVAILTEECKVWWSDKFEI